MILYDFYTIWIPFFREALGPQAVGYICWDWMREEWPARLSKRFSSHTIIVVSPGPCPALQAGSFEQVGFLPLGITGMPWGLPWLSHAVEGARPHQCQGTLGSGCCWWESFVSFRTKPEKLPKKIANNRDSSYSMWPMSAHIYNPTNHGRREGLSHAGHVSNSVFSWPEIIFPNDLARLVVKRAASRIH